MIPVRAGVSIETLHPTFLRRLEALHADPRTRGMLSIYSGVRSKAHQARLYAEYRAGGTLAADPDQVLGERTMFGQTFFAEGSWHMQQPSGWGYAADLAGYKALGETLWGELVPWHSDYKAGALAPFGLTRTVQPKDRSKWESWHVQPLGTVVTVYDAVSDPSEADMAEGIYVRGRGMTGFTFGQGLTVVAKPQVDVGAEHRKVFDLEDAPPSVEISDALWDQLAGAR